MKFLFVFLNKSKKPNLCNLNYKVIAVVYVNMVYVMYSVYVMYGLIT